MFTELRIRSKLAVALSIPLVALIGLSSLVVISSSQRAHDAAARSLAIGEQIELATASLGPNGVIEALQNERNNEAVALIGDEFAPPEPRPGETATTHRELSDLRARRFGAAIETKPEALRAAYQPALGALARLGEIRADIDANTAPRTPYNIRFSAAIFDRYSAILAQIFDANSRVALGVDDARLRTGARAIDLATRAIEDYTGLVRAVLIGTLTNPEGLTSNRAAWAEALTAKAEVAAQRANLEATPAGPYRDLVHAMFDRPQLRSYTAVLDRVIDGERTDAGTILGPGSAEALAVFTTFTADAVRQLEADAAERRATADADRAKAERWQQRVLVLTALVLIAAIGVILLATRSITRPLRRLVGDAEDMSGRRLPETVAAILDTPPGNEVEMPKLATVDSAGGREIADLARALNSVQTSAAALAVEQAVLRRNIADSFVNLGRRNQNLLSRQLDSITEMERRAADPDQLERLFTLDHLATRMRRNAESLLLLAGIEPQRQWSGPVPVIDVLRGALGEVENYERVSIRHVDPAVVNGSAAADLTHMVAELLENALTYSPPGRPVEVVGRASEGHYVLAVIDNGIGMSAEDIELANTRLAGTESFTVPPSRYLGHYVVGRQAARLGVAVHLQASPTSGVTAQIDIAPVLRGADDTLQAAPPSDLPDERDERAAAGGSVAGAEVAAPVEVETIVPAGTGPYDAAPVIFPRSPATTAATTATAEPESPTPLHDEPVDPTTDPTTDPANTPRTNTPGTNTPGTNTDAPTIDLPTPTGPGPTITLPKPEPVIVTPGAPVRSTTVEAGVTASGYRRRVRGAQTPRTDVLAARPSDEINLTDDTPVNAAEALRSALSGLQAGVSRGRADAEVERHTGELPAVSPTAAFNGPSARQDDE